VPQLAADSQHAEETMQNHKPIGDPHFRRLVHDFDELADLLHHIIDRDRPQNTWTESALAHDTDYTTEWQMDSMPEEVHHG
jgi:uncharacterized protein YdcH (DUF465 family)